MKHDAITCDGIFKDLIFYVGKDMIAIKDRDYHTVLSFITGLGLTNSTLL